MLFLEGTKSFEMEKEGQASILDRRLSFFVKTAEDIGLGRENSA